jgi:hypothetical protein
MLIRRVHSSSHHSLIAPNPGVLKHMLVDPSGSGVESVGDLDAQIEHRFDLHRLASDPMPERLPLQQFHRDEGSPIGLVNLVNRADVRVVQTRGCLSLPLETAESLCVVGEVVGKKLQGNVATELPVRENKALHVMRKDGNSRILRGEPYNNWSDLAVKIENFASMQSLASACCGRPLFDQPLICMGLAVVTLVRAVTRVP